MNIREIENLTENQAQEMSLETMEIKDHNVYFVDCGEYFGYSALVYKNNHHIYHADDYALHHTGKSQQELRELYINTLNNKLYTDQELAEPINDYDEFTAKEYFLHNYHPMQVDSISWFFIGSEAEREQLRKKVEGMINNQVGFCYNYQKDSDFVKHEYNLLNGLHERKAELKDNFEYYKKAFLYEMYNHEYGINWEADYDTLSAFGNIKHHDNDDLNTYFDDLGFTETQRNAYYAARKEYYNRESDNLY